MPYIYPVRRFRYTMPLGRVNRRRPARYWRSRAMRARAMRYQRANQLYNFVRVYNRQLNRY